MSRWGFGVLLVAAFWCPSASADTPPRAVIAHGRDIFQLPPNPNRGEGCDGRRLLIRDPEFGRGLVARYIYRRGPSRFDGLPRSNVTHPDDAEMTKNLKRRDIDAAFVRPDGIDGADAYAIDQTVLRTHDDMIKRFAPFCEAPLGPGYYLSDIEFRRATTVELEGKPLDYDTLRGVEPAKLGRYRDIMPKGAIVITFTVPAAYWIARGTLDLPIGYDDGLGTIYEFEGWNYGPDDDRIRKLTESGYQVLYLDFGGRREMVIIDTRPATSTDQLNARAKPVIELEWGPNLYLKRIAHVPARQAEVAHLRLSGRERDDLHQQVQAMTDRYRERDLARAHQKPTVQEMEALLAGRWKERSNRGNKRFERGAELTFGEIHDLICKRTGEIFACTVGFTYLWKGKPKYSQEDIKLTRDPAKNFELKEHIEPIIVT